MLSNTLPDIRDVGKLLNIQRIFVTGYLNLPILSVSMKEHDKTEGLTCWGGGLCLHTKESGSKLSCCDQLSLNIVYVVTCRLIFLFCR